MITAIKHRQRRLLLSWNVKRPRHILTSTENPDVVNLEQECAALLIDQFVLYDACTSERELLGLLVENVALLLTWLEQV